MILSHTARGQERTSPRQNCSNRSYMPLERVLIDLTIAAVIVISVAISFILRVAKRQELRERRDARTMKIAAERAFEAIHKEHA